MAPAIAWNELKRGDSETPLTVLDPMSGSGTTVVTARLLGHRGLAFDTDPLAVLIATAWSTDVDTQRLAKAGERVLAKARKKTTGMATRDAYPENADEETREFIRYWFDATPRKQLAALAQAISEERDGSTRALLWCAFSRLIIVKDAGASRAMDVSHSRPHRVYENAPLRPFDGYERALRVVSVNAPFADAKERLPVSVQRGDARRLPVGDQSVDVVVTSPPYLNAIDYLRGHKLSLVWMGHQIEALRELRASNVGTEVGAAAQATEKTNDPITRAVTAMCRGNLPNRELGMLRRYAKDMAQVLSEVARVLKHAGRAVLVVGNSTICGQFIRNSKGLEVLAAHAGLLAKRKRTRTLPPNRRYLPPPGAPEAGKSMDARMRQEVVLTFEKAAPGSN